MVFYLAVVIAVNVITAHIAPSVLQNEGEVERQRSEERRR